MRPLFLSSLFLLIHLCLCLPVLYPLGKSLLSNSIKPLPVYLAACVCACVCAAEQIWIRSSALITTHHPVPCTLPAVVPTNKNTHTGTRAKTSLTLQCSLSHQLSVSSNLAQSECRADVQHQKTGCTTRLVTTLRQVTSKMCSYPEHPLLTVDERVRKFYIYTGLHM